jgi:hypothetical protein
LRTAAAVQDLAYSPDGGMLAVAVERTVTLYPLDLPPEKLDPERLLQEALAAADMELQGSRAQPRGPAE